MRAMIDVGCRGWNDWVSGGSACGVAHDGGVVAECEPGNGFLPLAAQVDQEDLAKRVIVGEDVGAEAFAMLDTMRPPAMAEQGVTG